jgi:single-stranded DNA-binding protein
MDLLTCGLWRGGCVSLGTRTQKGSLLSVEGKMRIHHVSEKKGQTNTQSTRGKGNAEKKR